MKKRLIAMALVASMSTSITSLAMENGKEEVKTIKDIENHWAKKYIEEVLDKEAISCYSDGDFKPNEKIKIEEFIKLTIVSMFEDEFYEKGDYIKAAENLEITEQGEFKDYLRPVTREECAKIIAKAIYKKKQQEEELALKNDKFLREVKELGGKTIVARKDYLNFKTGFDDDENISAEKRKYINKLVDLKILGSYFDNTFRPKKEVTRAEAAEILQRVLNLKENKQKEKEMEEKNNKVIFERLRNYPVKQVSGNSKLDMKASNDLLKRKSNEADLILMTYGGMGMVSSYFNRDYQSLQENYGNLIKWSHSQEEVNNWVEEIKKYKINQDCEFITDKKNKSLMGVTGEGQKFIRGVLRFRYERHTNPSNIKNELKIKESNSKFDVGKWYEADVDVMLKKSEEQGALASLNFNYILDEYVYLSDFKEVKRDIVLEKDHETDKDQIVFKKLKEYKVEQNGKVTNFKSEQMKQGLSDISAIEKVTESAEKTIYNLFNRNYKNLPIDYWNNLVSNNLSDYAYKNKKWKANEFANNWIEETIKNEIVQEVEFITDKDEYSLTSKGLDGSWSIRGRLKLKYENHKEIYNAKYELKIDDINSKIELGKWYEADIELILSESKDLKLDKDEKISYKMIDFKYLRDFKEVVK